ELVGLLAVLTSALPVALAGDAAPPGIRLAGLAEGQRQVDEAQRRVGALAVLLGPPGGEHHDRCSLAEQAGGGGQLLDRDARDALDPVGPVRRGDPPSLVE